MRLPCWERAPRARVAGLALWGVAMFSVACGSRTGLDALLTGQQPGAPEVDSGSVAPSCAAPPADSVVTLATSSYGWGAVAVDAAAVYAVNGGTVVKVPLPCGGPPVLIGGTNVAAMTTDATNVYWIDWTTDSAFTVAAAAKTGGTPRVLATLTDMTPTSDGIAVGANAVYVLGLGLMNAGGCSGGIAHCQPGTVVRVPLDGSASTVLATQQAGPLGIAVDASRVYWITTGPDVYYPGDSQSQGTVVSAPLLGGPVTTLAAGQAQPDALYLLGPTLFWVNGSGRSLSSMPTAGGTPTTLIDSDLNMQAIAIATDGVYFVAFGSVEMVPPTGGMPTSVAMGPFAINDGAGIAVDEKYVYWGNKSALLRAPK